MKLSRRSFVGTFGAIASLSLLGGFASVSALAAVGSAGNPKRIGVIGSGRLGGTVGGIWVKAGHEVMFSSRHPEELKAMAATLGPRASVGTTREAAEFGEVLLFAVPYSALPQLGKDLGGALQGKIVLDACNPMANQTDDATREANANGAGPTTAKYLPGARVVRVFNAVDSTAVAASAGRDHDKLGMPLAGDDQGAVKVATQLVIDAGVRARGGG